MDLHILPIVTVQPSFKDVISEVNEGLIPHDAFWVSCYHSLKPSVHTKVHVKLDDHDRDVVLLEAQDSKVDVKKDGDEYHFACATLEIPPTKVVLPTTEYVDPQVASPQNPHPILAFDTAPDGSQFATGLRDGSVHLYAISDTSAALKSHSKAHFSSVNSVQFFPSSRVLLTAGGDFALTILPADVPSTTSDLPLSPVRKLQGHIAGVTATEIIARGRNVVSSSQDGTLRLWDVSAGKQISRLVAGHQTHTPVLALSLGVKDGTELGHTPLDSAPSDDCNAETQDKLVWCALANGSFETFDLGSKQSVYRSLPPVSKSPLNTITVSGRHHLLATGSRDGVVTLHDTRSLSTPLMRFKRSAASIEKLAWVCSGSEAGLAVAGSEGLTFVARFPPDGPRVATELVGPDCDGTRVVKVAGEGYGDIWTAGDDGIVRRYSSQECTSS